VLVLRGDGCALLCVPRKLAHERQDEWAPVYVFGDVGVEIKCHVSGRLVMMCCMRNCTEVRTARATCTAGRSIVVWHCPVNESALLRRVLRSWVRCCSSITSSLLVLRHRGFLACRTSTVVL